MAHKAELHEYSYVIVQQELLTSASALIPPMFGQKMKAYIDMYTTKFDKVLNPTC